MFIIEKKHYSDLKSKTKEGGYLNQSHSVIRKRKEPFSNPQMEEDWGQIINLVSQIFSCLPFDNICSVALFLYDSQMRKSKEGRKIVSHRLSRLKGT